MRPRKRVEKYTIVTGGSILREEVFIPEVRHEGMPRWNLARVVHGKVEEPFDRDKSVFKPWLKDTPISLNNALTNDLMYWKGPKFIKDPEDLERVIDLIRKNYTQLKNIYHTLIGGDSYPSIGMNEFTSFAKVSGILDGSIPFATVDRMFIAVNATSSFEGAAGTKSQTTL